MELAPWSTLRSLRFSMKWSRWLCRKELDADVITNVLKTAQLHCYNFSVVRYFSISQKRFNNLHKSTPGYNSFSFMEVGKLWPFINFQIWGCQKYKNFTTLLLTLEIWCKCIWKRHHPCQVIQIVSWYHAWY